MYGKNSYIVVMHWPPLKAWTSKSQICGSRHFVAINYGGEIIDRWIHMTSVLDGSISMKISCSDLQDPSKWIEGWEANDFLETPVAFVKQCDINLCHSMQPSDDSGLSIPIFKKEIRPWFKASLI